MDKAGVGEIHDKARKYDDLLGEIENLRDWIDDQHTHRYEWMEYELSVIVGSVLNVIAPKRRSKATAQGAFRHLWRQGCEHCFHGVYASGQGNIPCPECSPGEWDNLRLVQTSDLGD